MLFKNWWSFRRKKKNSYSERVELVSSKRVFTPVSQLALGMYVAELDRPWLETSFMFQGFELKTKAEINAVKQACEYVYIDTTKKRKKSPADNYRTQTSFPNVLNHGLPPKKLGSFEQEILRAEKAYGHTEILVSAFMKRAAHGGSLDGWLAKKAVAECVNSVLHSPDAMLWLTQLKNKHEYTMQHSINVCVLAIVLGRHLNLPEKHLQNLGLCGLLHDIGKMLIPNTILNKENQLDEEELKIMQSHTTLGYELLKSSDHMHASVIETALTHHERLDGKGYPRQIKQAGISDFSKIVAIADTYDAITSDRFYKAGKTHIEAINILTNEAGTRLDPTLVVKFIESLGVYPPGCLVELTNKAIAIVVEVNEEMRLRPKIILLQDEEKNPAPEQLIDLSKMGTDKNGGIYTIKNVIKNEMANINFDKFYQKAVLQKCFSMN